MIIKCSVCNQKFNKKTIKSVCSIKCEIIAFSYINEKGCWIWKRKCQSIYPKIRWNYKTISAHRASFEAFKRKILSNKNICHTCDNPKCVNPDHLWMGTQKQNIQDCVRKKRFTGTKGLKWTESHRRNFHAHWKAPNKKGEAHHQNKLTEKDVKEIRKMLKENLKQSIIANKFRVSQSTISYIKSGRLWSHLD